MRFEIVEWAEFKSFVDSRSLNIQFRETENVYFLKAADHWFGLECNLNKTTDTSDVSDFETNYKSLGNSSLKLEVVTQFEKNDKDLKLASIKDSVNGTTGEATLDLKIPGVSANGDGRWVSGGVAWFSNPHIDDIITEVVVIDKDNVLGYGANFIAKEYYDSESPEPNQGWRIPEKIGYVSVEAIGGYGFIPAELYLRLKCKKGGSATFTGNFYANISWGKIG